MLQPWFKEAKLGIFMHWGIYSAGNWGESWPFYHGQVSYEDYMAQAKEFTAANFDPKHWAEVFKKAGANYTVLTTKHHDGFALWDTKENDWSAAKSSPAGRDLIGPYCDAMREAGLRVGLYFSHLDWSHPDYASVYKTGCGKLDFQNEYAVPIGKKEDPKAWKRFLAFHKAQLTELMTSYGTIDLMWFDGDWDRTPEQWEFKKVRDMLHKLNPNVILNSRIAHYGDYSTPEQAIPVEIPEGMWEFNMTMNNHWGYVKKDEHNNKPLWMIIRIFTECLSGGGNLLLDIGPKADGSLQEDQEKILLEFGAWNGKYAEAIYPTEKGIPMGHFYGPTTLSKDKKSLYLFVHDKPKGGIPVKGLVTEIEKVTLLGADKELSCEMVGGAPWDGVPGITWIYVDEADLDPLTSVVKIDFKEPLKLYRGKSGAIVNNIYD